MDQKRNNEKKIEINGTEFLLHHKISRHQHEMQWEMLFYMLY